MQEMTEILGMVNKISKWTANIPSLAGKLSTMSEESFGETDAALLSFHLERAADALETAVKRRFLKLNHEHIAYVLESLSKNTTLVKNIKAYTLAALYNAPTTISQYYASLVSHDLAQDAAGI